MSKRGFWTGLVVGLVIMGLIAAVAGFVMFRMGGTAACAGAQSLWGEGRQSRGGYSPRMPMMGRGMGHMFFMPGGLLMIGALVLAWFAGRHWGHHCHHGHGHHHDRHHECCGGHEDAPQASAEDVPPASQA